MFRGNCTFLVKALNAQSAHAKFLVVIDNETELVSTHSTCGAAVISTRCVRGWNVIPVYKYISVLDVEADSLLF